MNKRKRYWIDESRKVYIARFYEIQSGKNPPQRTICTQDEAEYKILRNGRRRKRTVEEKEKFIIERIGEVLLQLKHQENLKEAEQVEKAKAPFISDLMQEYLDSLVDHTAKTKQTYTHSLNLYIETIGNHRIDEFERSFKDKLLTHLKSRNIATTTQKAHVVQLQVFFNWLYDEEIIDRPIKLKKPKVTKQEVRIFSKGQLEKMEAYLLDQIKNGIEHRKQNYLQHYRIFLMVSQTAMRAGEVWDLHLKNIDLNKGFIYIKRSKQWNPKKGIEGKIQISPKLETFLKLDLESRNKKEKYFLDDGTGKKGFTNVYGMSQAFARHWKKLGITVAKPIHGIRASVLTFITASHGIAVAQKIGRHTQITTTANHYLDDEELDTVGALALL